MNELTKKLVNQFATNLLNRSGYDMREYEPFISEAEKFAELIVKECFKAAMIESKGHMNPIDLMKRMKERVGVEE